jgi:uroporphyrinogen-III decarboxylase
MDIPTIHARYPNITMIGNISSFTLHTGCPADVEEETRSCLLEAKETGKVIAGCSNVIMPQTPMKNVETMLMTISKYR